MATSNQTLQDVLKLIYLVPQLGEYAILPDGAIVNIGGVIGPNFTVGGKPLLFADGTATDGTVISILKPDLQNVYDNSVGEGFIDCTPNKDFVLQAVNDKQFRFDANTGLVTITGDLIVRGTTTTIIKTSVETDRVAIHQDAGDYTPFIMEPVVGVVPTVNVVDIKTEFGGDSVFSIGPGGTTWIKDLNVGSVNGIDLATLVATINSHINLESAEIKHTAAQISVAESLAPAENVQQALEQIVQRVNTVEQIVVGVVRGFEFVQQVPATVWSIMHGANTNRVQVQVWNSDNEVVFSDTIKIIDSNNVIVTFNTPITGRAILMLF